MTHSLGPRKTTKAFIRDPVTASKEKFEIKKNLPVMPIRDAVIFPYMMTPFVVGRESSVRALEEALAADKKIFLATQHDASVDEPKLNEIYQVGTLANIVQRSKLPDGNIKVLVEGVERGKILQVIKTEGFMQATVRLARYFTKTTPQIETGMQRVSSLFDQYLKLCLFDKLEVSSWRELYKSMIAAVQIHDPAKLTDTIAANLLPFSIEEKQEFLEIFDPAERLSRLGDMLDIKVKTANMDPCIQSRRELDEMLRIIVAHGNRLNPPFSAPPRSPSSWMSPNLRSVELLHMKLTEARLSRVEENVKLMRRWFKEVWNEGKTETIHELLATGAVAVGELEDGVKLHGPAEFAAFSERIRGAFPDMKIAVEDVFGAGDKVVLRWSGTMTHLGDHLGMPATGKAVQVTGITIARIANGQIVEGWDNWDQLGMLKQLGSTHLPSPHTR